MRRGVAVTAAVGMAILLCGASPEQVPEEVAAHMRDMADACKQVDGTPLPDPFIEHGNLADRLEFWAINEGAFRCDEPVFRIRRLASRRLSVLAGYAREVFAHGVEGMTIERTGHSAKLWVGVGGPLCGQKGNPTHAEAINCDRSLRWEAKAQKLEFAPLSPARIPGRLRNQ